MPMTARQTWRRRRGSDTLRGVFSRRKKQERARAISTPDEAKVLADMARPANAFVTGSAEEGHHFDYAVENAPRLDALVDLFRRSQPSDDVVHSMALSMGAHVGELIVRNGAGSWTYSPEADSPGVLLASGLVCFPLNKVAKRIKVGPTHSIAQFVEVAMSGVLPPGAQPVKPTPGG
jgi:hypothetical protein